MLYYIIFLIFYFLLVFGVGGLGFEFFMFLAGWRYALRSEWPFIIIIITTLLQPITTWAGYYFIAADYYLGRLLLYCSRLLLGPITTLLQPITTLLGLLHKSNLTLLSVVIVVIILSVP